LTNQDLCYLIQEHHHGSNGQPGRESRTGVQAEIISHSLVHQRWAAAVLRERQRPGSLLGKSAGFAATEKIGYTAITQARMFSVLANCRSIVPAALAFLMRGRRNRDRLFLGAACLGDGGTRRDQNELQVLSQRSQQ